MRSIITSYFKITTFAALNFSRNLALWVILSESEILRGVASVKTSAKPAQHMIHMYWHET